MSFPRLTTIFVTNRAKHYLAITVIIAVAVFPVGACSQGTTDIEARIETLSVTGVEALAPIPRSREIEVWVTGNMLDKCSRIVDVALSMKERQISLSLITDKIDTEGCGETESTDFLQIVPIDVSGLEEGSYEVEVNGLTAPFQVNGI